MFKFVKPVDAKKLALAVSRDTGMVLYLLARSIAAKTVVEFGTSFGFSTIFLAAAVKDNGGGMVIGSEIDPDKHAIALRNIERCGLADVVDIRLGDATETLRGIAPALDLVFLDGWKDLYLPVLRNLEPALRPGAVVCADNVAQFPNELASYVAHVSDPAGDYVTAMPKAAGGLTWSVRVKGGRPTAPRDAPQP